MSFPYVEGVFKIRNEPVKGTLGDFMESLLEFADTENSTNEDLTITQEDDLDKVTDKIFGSWFAQR